MILEITAPKVSTDTRFFFYASDKMQVKNKFLIHMIISNLIIYLLNPIYRTNDFLGNEFKIKNRGLIIFCK